MSFRRNTIAFLAGLGLAGVCLVGDTAEARNYWWSGQDPCNNLWTNPDNWWPKAAGVPEPNDTVLIGKGDFWANYPDELHSRHTKVPLIDCNVNARCKWLLGPCGGPETSSHYELNITGGRLVIGSENDPDWLSGWDIGCVGEGNRGGGKSGTVNISSGQVIVAATMKVGAWGGTGTINMTDGTIKVGRTLYCPYSEGTGYINLHGGTIEAGDFEMDKVFIVGLEGKGLVDITGGKLVVAGNRIKKICGYVDKGWITAYGGKGEVIIEYEAGVTKISASTGVSDSNSRAFESSSITIDCSQRLQRIDGFGAAMTGGFGIFERGNFETIVPEGVRYKTTFEQRKAMADVAVRQLGLTHMRLFLGAGVESQNDNNDPNVLNLDTFAEESQDRELSGEREKEDRRMSLRESAEFLNLVVPLGLENWIVTPMEMPDWLTELSRTNERRFFAEYAEWAAGQLLYLKKVHKLEAPYWSMYNEPDPKGWKSAQWWIPWVKAAGQRFRREGLATKIMVPDFMNVYDAVGPTEAMLKDDEVRRYIGAIAYHHYRSSFLGPGPFLYVTSRADTADAGKLYEQLTNGARAMAELGGRYNLPSWQTEAAYYPQAMKDTGFSTWEIGRARANEIYYELSAGAGAFETMLMVWVDVIDPRYDFPVRMEGHYIVLKTDGVNVTEWQVTKDCGAVLGHWGRYIRPGDHRIFSRCSDWTLRATAFVSERNNRYAVVVINNSSVAKNVTFKLDNMAWDNRFVGGFMTDQDNTLTPRRINPCENQPGSYEAGLPPLSLCTFVWSKQPIEALAPAGDKSIQVTFTK